MELVSSSHPLHMGKRGEVRLAMSKNLPKNCCMRNKNREKPIVLSNFSYFSSKYYTIES